MVIVDVIKLREILAGDSPAMDLSDCVPDLFIRFNIGTKALALIFICFNDLLDVTRTLIGRESLTLSWVALQALAVVDRLRCYCGNETLRAN